MFCPNCGSENADGAKVCSSCGAELNPDQTAGQKPAGQVSEDALAGKPKNSGGTIAKVAVAVVAVMLLILIIAGISGGGRSGNYTFVKQNVTILTTDDKSSSTVFVDGKALKDTIGGEAYLIFSSIDGTVSLIEADDDGEPALYSLRGKTLNRIDEFDADSKASAFSSTGEGFAYTTNDGEETTLLLYNVAKKKSTVVKTASGGIECTAVSPDGKTLAYTVDEDGGSVCYFYNGKNSVKLGADVTVLGLSDGGKYIYGISGDEDEDGNFSFNLYTKKGDKKRKIGETAEGILFNEDHTQVVYGYDDKIYISANGKEGERFFNNDDVSLILPDDCYSVHIGYSLTYPVDSFYDLFYYSDGGIYQLKKNYDKKEKLASNVADSYFLTEDGERIYFAAKNHDVKMIKTSWGEKALENVVTVAENVDDYVVTSDYGRVYYKDGDDLYSVNGNGKSNKLITDEVEEADLYLAKNDVLFFNKGRDLYACSDGKSAKLARTDCSYAGFAGGGYFFFRSDDNAYCATGSKKLKKVFSYN